MSSAFRYRASTHSGQLLEGSLAATSRSEALDELRRRDLVPVLVEPEADRHTRFHGRYNEAAATAARSIATLLDGGSAVEHAIDFVARECRVQRLQRELLEVRRRMVQGDSVSEAFGETAALGPLASATLRAADGSGQLAEGFSRLADHLERSLALRAQLMSALLYPALMGLVSLIGVVVLLVAVVPRFSVMLADSGGVLPLSTRLLIGVSSVVSRAWWIVLAAGVGTVVLWRQWTRSAEGRLAWHQKRLELPVFGELEHLAWNARFLRSMQMLLAAGDSTLGALQVAGSSVGNAALVQRVEQATKRVSQGERIGPAFQSVLLPLASQLLAVGEEGGGATRLAEMCGRAAEAFDRQLERRMKSAIALVEPGLIIVFGIVVGFVALAMLQAIYSINASVL